MPHEAVQTPVACFSASVLAAEVALPGPAPSPSFLLLPTAGLVSLSVLMKLHFPVRMALHLGFFFPGLPSVLSPAPSKTFK